MQVLFCFNSADVTLQTRRLINAREKQTLSHGLNIVDKQLINAVSSLKIIIKSVTASHDGNDNNGNNYSTQ